jgi:hypothetical protein
MSEINFNYESPIAARSMNKLAATSTNPEKFKYYWAENVIGRAVRLSQGRVGWDFTESVCLGPRESDLTLILGR